MNKKRFFSVIYMFTVTLVFTAIVSGVHLANRQRIGLNEQARIHRVILKVLDIELSDQTTNAVIEKLFSDRIKTFEQDGKIVYVGFSETGKQVIGYAFPVSGPGFWGPIFGMVGVDPSLEKILGIAFYDHNETPGLGGRITEKWFEDQFKGKPLMVADGSREYFAFRPAGTAQRENEVDAISGASETTRRLERLLNLGLHEYLTWLKQEQIDRNIPTTLEESAHTDLKRM